MKFKNPKHQNLFKLAGYLLRLPKNYSRFNMNIYHSGDDERVPPKNCNAIACALGHSLDVGFKPVAYPELYDNLVDWTATANKHFLSGDDKQQDDEYMWLFAGNWARTDDTPHGAAMRMCWLITNGLPDNYLKQLNGIDPLCYR